MYCNAKLLNKYAEEAGKPGIINLGASEGGRPPFPAKRAIRDCCESYGFRHYAPVLGIPELRRAVSDWFGRSGVAATPETTLITAGSRSAVSAALKGVLYRSPRREITTLLPAWPVYEEMVGAINCARFIPKIGFGFRGNQISTYISPNTRGVILSSPTNPTGAVLDLSGLAQNKTSSQTWFIVDGAYWGLEYDGKKTDWTVLLPERTIFIGSSSKLYALAGLRVGFLTVPEPMFSTVARFYAADVGSASLLSQEAVLAAMTNSDSYVQRRVGVLAEKRDFLVGWLKEHEIDHPHPEGAFYCFCDFSHCGPSVSVADKLLERAGVGIIPGTAFGPFEGWQRISFAEVPLGELEDALCKIEEVLF
ncbi:MAG: hypothetical protein A2427_03345 [Candidatus Nealsonbacteria bacterium RIFOXYC1_FULL_40_7]|uniref:Aminotransferase class I/classII large domain-containing protein n=2 Tax=Candidatus Nealsoniibacteriota TaxID=1817911 RepID=A0A1G2EQL1_9BACT|nr:MAG: hypothetical protein A2427_03345 [Candidatus Nealsonbacteria bacterium RIFOXYC1_FULL_40_7]OGZ28534.1 MAG: hypothetical protein A2562_03555 [Candidatus Nealsonbacteria bacterium RIFOXYD1_FULL_39_11]